MTVSGLTPSAWQALCRALASVFNSDRQDWLQEASPSNGANKVLSQLGKVMLYASEQENEKSAMGCKSYRVMSEAAAKHTIQAASRNRNCMLKMYCWNRVRTRSRRCCVSACCGMF